MADSARITYTNIARQSFWNLYNLINNRSNIPDPNNSAGTRKFVYQSRIPNLGRNFAGFPFILVSRSKPSKGKTTADLSKKFHSFDFTVTVYSQDTDSDSSGNPSGAETADTITNSIINTLDNPTNRKTLLNYLMGSLEYDIDTNEDELEGKAVFITEFDIRFENNLIKSA